MNKAQRLAAEVNKALGKGTIKFASDDDFKVTYLPTGILPFDALLHGGLPRGRMVEVYGDYSTLKSYIGLHAIATTQRAGGTCALLDMEHRFDAAWAEELGVDLAALLIPPIETGEQAGDVTEMLVRQDVDLIVWDSVAATLPKAEHEKSLSAPVQPARQAELFSRMMRKLTAANSKTAFYFANQTRESVGVSFGNPTTVPGGKALKFYASFRIGLSKAGYVGSKTIRAWDGEKMSSVKSHDAQRIRAKVEKSSLTKPYGEAFLVFDFESGTIDEATFLLNYGLEQGYVHNEGTKWWAAGSQKKYTGVKRFLGSDEIAKLRTKVEQELLGHPKPVSKRAVKRRKPSQKNSASNSTRTRVPAKSKTMRRTMGRK